MTCATACERPSQSATTRPWLQHTYIAVLQSSTCLVIISRVVRALSHQAPDCTGTSCARRPPLCAYAALLQGGASQPVACNCCCGLPPSVVLPRIIQLQKIATSCIYLIPDSYFVCLPSSLVCACHWHCCMSTATSGDSKAALLSTLCQPQSVEVLTRGGLSSLTVVASPRSSHLQTDRHS